MSKQIVKSKRWNAKNSIVSPVKKAFINAAIGNANRRNPISLQKLDFTSSVTCRICGEEGHSWQKCGND